MARRIAAESSTMAVELGSLIREMVSSSAVRRATLVMKGDTAYQPEALYQAVGVKPFLPSENLASEGVAAGN